MISDFSDITQETEEDVVTGLPTTLRPLRRGIVNNTRNHIQSPKGTTPRHFLTHNQEIYIDSASPMILINDSNAATMTPRSTANLLGSTTTRIRDFSEHEGLNSRRLDSSKVHRNSILSEIDSGLQTPSKSLATINDSPHSGHKFRSPFEAFKTPEPKPVDIFEQKTEKKVQEKKPSIIKLSLKRLLDSKLYTFLMVIFIIFALFGDDMRTALLDAPADPAVDAVLLLTVAFFSLEIIISLWVRDKYLWSFFFWLDIISTLSIICDVNFIANDVFPTG